jgi:precorrin-3B synthase
MTETLARQDSFTVRGWCPSALRPMQSGDGLIVRVHPRHNALHPAELIGLADIARRHGNGLIDLTRRSNLQLRGVTGESLPHVWSDLAQIGLLDGADEVEVARNILIGPLAGIDTGALLDSRSLADQLAAGLSANPQLRQLPAKFSFVVDDGGMYPLDEERADIRLRATSVDGIVVVAIGIDRADRVLWLGQTTPDAAARAACLLAAAFLDVTPSGRARMRDLSQGAAATLRDAASSILAPLDHIPPAWEAVSFLGRVTVEGVLIAVGLAAPFGRLDAATLKRLGELAAEAGVGEVRLSPRRALYMPLTSESAASRLIAGAVEAGLIADVADPLLAIDACPGAEGCASAKLDTRAAALELAPRLNELGVRSCHVSGCPKGCARSAPADLTLVGAGDCFAVLRYDTAQGKPLAHVHPASLGALRETLKTT